MNILKGRNKKTFLPFLSVDISAFFQLGPVGAEVRVPADAAGKVAPTLVHMVVLHARLIYIPVVGGIAVHFFRDIVATTFLKKFPSAYHHAALLLLDSEQTVKDNYGHLKHEDAFSLWNRHLSEEAV